MDTFKMIEIPTMMKWHISQRIQELTWPSDAFPELDTRTLADS